jgi:hypothetical protein
MCDDCKWEDAGKRAKAIAGTLPSWRTRNVAFFESVAETIEEKKHVSERQMECIEEGEDQVG